ncbi:hypothetical protein Ddye_010585 [Dipteronia dyeriana]|uniref:3-oxo-5-alpha-steroid 4-dehydrogenase C-terminal domain-containing protein n=1 Tax=Dipteronia dyeriana TaxID=168575 RepID=A0AAD9XEH3_9ROSI|nr:hypothetical protein Ddye_010585 [Dipteronia dyeriana]
MGLPYAYLQASWVPRYKDNYDNTWLFTWRFVIGLLVLVGGMCVNVWSDKVLVGIKKQGGGIKYPEEAGSSCLFFAERSKKTNGMACREGRVGKAAVRLPSLI